MSSSLRELTGKVRLRKKRLLFLAALAVLVVVILLGTRSLGSYTDIQNEEEWALSLREAQRDRGINYLLYGFLENEEEVFVKDIIFMNYSSPQSLRHIIHIPGELLLQRRESKIELAPDLTAEEDEQENEEKPIATFYTPGHFMEEGGSELLVEQLSYSLGVPVHHYLGLDYAGIPAMIDYRGGIPYKGYVLDGDDYFDYFLGNDGEEPLQRTRRRVQQITTLVDFLGDKRGLFSTPRMLREAAPYLDTDLSWKELQDFYASMEPLLEPDTMILELPGSWRDFNGAYYFEPDYVQVGAIMDNLDEDFILPRELITVEVLNGCGVPGIAAYLGDLLEEEGFSVVNVDNADSFDYERSKVISRIEEMSAAREVAVLVPGAEMLKEPDPQYEAMITVIIGKNFPFE